VTISRLKYQDPGTIFVIYKNVIEKSLLKTMKIILQFTFFLALALTGCEKKIDNWTTPGSDFEIKYFQSSGWTGWKFYTTITYPDSLLIYERELIPIPKERRSKYLLDKNELDTLVQCLQKLKNINLSDYYGFGPNKPTDLPTTFFKYINYKIIDSAAIYCPEPNEVPNDLMALLGRINRLIIDHDTLLNNNK
jgi:hypothetical protein